MRKRVLAASAAAILGPLSSSIFASIAVEQIEAYTNSSAPYTAYAPVNFANASSITLYTGQLGGFFPGITFYAVDTANENNTYSDHAYTVGRDWYGTESVAYGYVTSVYADPYDDFLNAVGTNTTTGVGTAPGDFVAGVKVVNTSYIVDYGSAAPNTATTDLDAIRRMDYMINHDDVTFVASAVSNVGDGNTYYLNWSDFNSLAVSGVQSLGPTGGPGKQHADLYGSADASFATAVISGYASALDGQAQTATQTDAIHGVVTRSLLMAGADKTIYTRQTANNLDTYHGAGEADYATSLGILEGGEKPLLLVTSNAASGTPSTTQQGWSYGNVSAGTQSVLLFNSSNTITGLTASLNWNVTSPTASGNINTSNAALLFPNLTLEVRSVTYNTSTHTYVLGANQSNTMLHSAATGDNVQYLYDTSSLPAGSYAFLIGGDPALTPAVGFSYVLSGSFASQWNKSTGGSWATSSNWTNSIPNGRAAQANFLASPGVTTASTITLDGSYTVGQIAFNNSNGYTISPGTGGGLTLDDTGDSSGTINPLITLLGGSQTIAVPIVAVAGATININSGAALNLTGTLSAASGVIKTGAGALTIGNALSASSFDFQAGTTTVTTAGSFSSGMVSIESGSTFAFSASTTTGLFIRNLPVLLNINSGSVVSVSATATFASRQLLNASAGINIAGSTDNWTGKLDLGNNDLDIVGASLATIANQIKQGYNNGKWNGSGGIFSSSAASNTAHLTALGVIQNNQSGTAIYTTSNLFDTTTPGVSDILVKYTYYGDANLDGKVDGTDYSRIDNGYLMHLTGWFNGDFNYDGVVNGSDYTLIDNAFNSQGTVLAAQIASPTAQVTAQVSAVPEPGALTWFAASATSMLLSRRKHRSVAFYG